MKFVVAQEIPGKRKTYFVGFYKNCAPGSKKLN